MDDGRWNTELGRAIWEWRIARRMDSEVKARAETENENGYCGP